MNRALPLAAFAFLSVLRPWIRAPDSGPVSPLAPERELASLVPASCCVFLDASGALPLFEQGLEHAFVQAVLSGPLGKVLQERMPLSLEASLAAADAWLGAPAPATIAEAAGRGLGLAFDPATKKTVIVAIGRDAFAVEHATGLLFRALERQFRWPGAFDRPHDRWSAADVWLLGDEGVIARRGELLVLGNGRELVQATLELTADPNGRGLFSREAFVTAAGERGAANVWAWIDMQGLEPFGDEGFRGLRMAAGTPPVQGLLGERIGALLGAQTLTLGLLLDGGRGASLHARGFGSTRVQALSPLARDGLVPAQPDSGGMGEALLYRDFGRFLAERSKLFPPEVQAGFAEAITNGALFFEGKDLGTDVLPRLSPWIRLVAREPSFGEGRRPEIPLPGLAVVGVLDDERDGEPWMAAFQSLVAILNVDRAQKGGKAMRLSLDREGEVEICSARFATPGPSDGVDVRYNLEPALAVVGRQLVLGTHESLVRALVVELSGAPPQTAEEGTEHLTLDARGLRSILEANLSPLVANKMLTDGLSRAQAEKEIDGLRALLAALDRLHLETREQDPTSPELDLWLGLSPDAGSK